MEKECVLVYKIPKLQNNSNELNSYLSCGDLIE